MEAGPVGEKLAPKPNGEGEEETMDSEGLNRGWKTRRVLIGYDGSDGANDAVALAHTLCGDTDARYLLVHVLPFPGPPPVAGELLGYQEAARVDPAMAVGWRETLAGRERLLAQLLGSFTGEFAPGVDLTEATDRFIALTTPEIYRTLVAERGWSPQRFEAWLGDLLVHQLLEHR